MKKYTFKLTAGEVSTFDIVGNNFFIVSAPEPVQCEFYDSYHTTELLEGLGVTIKPFKRFSLKSDLTQTIVVMAGFGDVQHGRLAGAIQSTNSLASANSFGAVSVGVAATLVKAANSSRASLLIQPTDGDIFVGSDNTVTVANGIKVLSGGDFECANTLDLYAIAAAPVDVRFCEDTF